MWQRFLAGLGLQHAVPLTVGKGASFIKAEHVVGTGLIAAGILLALSCLGIVLFVRMTAIPFAKAAKLVTWGPIGMHGIRCA